MTPDRAASPEGLAQRLRRATHDVHRQTEQAGIMPALLQGRLGRRAYCELLRNLFEIYRALEAALNAHRNTPAVAPVVFPNLFRADALERDLEILHSPDWRSDLAIRTTTAGYVRRLRLLDREQPGLLPAHAYVRYLGDLSGGQILRERLTVAFGLSSGEGTRFYDFGSADNVATAADALRRGLDALPVREEHIGVIVDEAQLAFRMHRELFEALAAHSGGPERAPCPLTD